MEHKETCAYCYGTGEVKCEVCGGSGEMQSWSLLDQECLKCQGTGLVAIKEETRV